MGDEVLKPLRYFLILIFCFALSFAQNPVSLLDDTKSYDQIFEKIAEKRLGVQNQMIDTIANPFEAVLKKDPLKEENNETAIKEPSFVLQAILSQKAKINDKWYCKHDTIGEYELVALGRDHVILQSETEKKELHIRNQDDAKVKISFK